MPQLIINDYDKQVYEKEIKDFLPDKFIDIHTHIKLKTMTPLVPKKPGEKLTWVSMVLDELPVEQLLEFNERLFPGKKVLPLIFGSCTEVHKEVNDYTLASAKKYNLPALYRTSYDMTADFLEQEVKKGGFLGLKPYLTSRPPYIPVNEIRIFDFVPHEHWEVANKNGWIVMLHIARDGRLKDPLNVAQLMEIEEKYPNVKLVVAHIGRAYSKQDMGDAFETLKHTKNMLFDFTANLCADAIEGCIKAVGTDRLLFGSDLPVPVMRMYRIVDENGMYINVVPRGMYGDVSHDIHMKETDETDVTLMMYEQLLALKETARRLKLSDSDIEKIMYLNSKKLLNTDF